MTTMLEETVHMFGERFFRPKKAVMLYHVTIMKKSKTFED